MISYTYSIESTDQIHSLICKEYCNDKLIWIDVIDRSKNNLQLRLQLKILAIRLKNIDLWVVRQVNDRLYVCPSSKFKLIRGA
jgi:hypothetical protein